jgi:UDP-N-acetylmuramate--alanine ligase
MTERDGLYSFEVYRNGSLMGESLCGLPGRHNVLNALAVVAAAVNAGAPPEAVLQSLPEFAGMDRRLMLKGTFSKITVLDDYAHHPTEIRASLEAVRQRYRPARLWCVFQPHQYSRTRFLLDDFAESFKLADETIVPEIYFVRDSESSRKLVNAEMLAEKIRGNGGRAAFINGFSGICEHLKQNVKPGEAVITMGAGNVWKVADEYLQWLRENR